MPPTDRAAHIGAMNILLSIGHGYAADAVAQALPRDWQIIATTRRPERAAELSARGLGSVVWEPGGSCSPLREALARATHVISSVAPGRGGGDDPVAPVLARGLDAARNLRWLGYMSASSVYGDQGGDWVDEHTPAAPGTDRGLARLRAEETWSAIARSAGVPAAMFRIGGIYGPGRSVLDGLRAGTAQRVIKPGQVFSRIHVADLGRIIAAAAERAAQGPFNAVDEEPAPPQDVTEFGAGLLGLPVPPDVPFDAAALSPMARSFYAENKRVRSVRLDADLGLSLLYPDYRAGLRAIAAG